MKLNRLLLFLCSIMFSCTAFAQGKIEITDLKLTPADIAEPISPLRNITDGHYRSDSEIFHTLWSGIPKQDVTIEATLDGKGKRLDQIILRPRATGINGVIRQAEIYVMYEDTYHLTAVFTNILRDNSPTIVYTKINNPQRVKIKVRDTYSSPQDKGKYFVSLGELECIMRPDNAPNPFDLRDDETYFKDAGTKLRTPNDKNIIQKIKIPQLRELAKKIQKNEYNPGLRYAKYEAYMSPHTLGEQMRIGDGFSKLEGITGVILPQGDNIIFVGETHGAKISLVIPDWTRKAPDHIADPTKDPAGWGLRKDFYPLTQGINLVDIKKEGLAYIQYYVDDDPENHQPIEVHFLEGKENGYFDITRGDDNQTFNSLLNNAKGPIMDMRGKYIQVAFPVADLRSLTYDQGVELIQNYDSIIALQRHFIGWDKEGLFPKNHVLARINHHYYMFRDQDGVAYIDWAMPLVAVPSSILKGDPCWGFSHELGHVLQMRPQLTWGGMTEVSNNFMTMYSTTKLGNKSRLSEEGVYAKARAEILDKGISYMDYPGPAFNANQYGGNGNTDVFQRLVPFWQLQLYFTRQGYPDFYADLMIALRRQEPLGNGDPNLEYLNMLEFCRLACEVSQTDLTEFFERWGFFYVGDIDVQDYWTYNYHVTQEEVDAVKKAIADMHLPKPTMDITQLED